MLDSAVTVTTDGERLRSAPLGFGLSDGEAGARLPAGGYGPRRAHVIRVLLVEDQTIVRRAAGGERVVDTGLAAAALSEDSRWRC